jgi:hypothetical protein
MPLPAFGDRSSHFGDAAWHEFVYVRMGVHSGLSDTQKEAVDVRSCFSCID